MEGVGDHLPGGEEGGNGLPGGSVEGGGATGGGGLPLVEVLLWSGGV